MDLSVAINWDSDLISKISNYHSVKELFGSLSADFIGGGRSSSTLPPISKKQAMRYIAEIHKKGLKFNYLLNATCLDNLEWTISGQRKIQNLLQWLVDIKVDTVTVSIPYLLQLIKNRYPQLEVCVSTQAGIDTVERARYWEDLGADAITLSCVDVNRNFRLLKELRAKLKCKLKLIANLDCLYHCPFYKYHSVLNSHASQDHHMTGGFMIDYCYLSCNYRKISNPVEFIRAPWIRPEDLCHYEDIGIDMIKLVNRGMSTEALLLVTEAYNNKEYNGNLLDLFCEPAKNTSYNYRNLFHKLKYFFRPFSVNIFKFIKARNLFERRDIYIDNKALDGFIEHFLVKDCRLVSCDDCGYCKEIATKVVKIDADYQRKMIAGYKAYLNGLFSGDTFKY